MKYAFVASGGGLKAYAYHMGVLRALEEGGFRRVIATQPPHAVAHPSSPEIGCWIGSSAGACVAVASVFFASLDDAEGVIGLRPTRHPRFTPFSLFHPNWRFLRDRTGLCTTRNVQSYFHELAVIDDFRRIAPEVFICATQLNSSRKVIFGPRDSGRDGRYDKFVAYYDDVSISNAVAASVAVPGIFRPHRIVNQRSGETFEYTDGEIRETLSVHIARDVAVDTVIVSNTWMPYHFDPRAGSVSKMGLGALITQTLTQIIEQKVDRFRNETDRHHEAVEAIREVGRAERLDPRVVELLVGRVSEILRFRKMDQIYIAPSRTDTRFTLAPSWTFDTRHLGRARDVGYERARDAIARWKRTQRPRPVDLTGAPARAS